MLRERHAWDSPSLRRPMELLWYGHWGRPLLAFPTSLGHANQNEDFGLVRGLEEAIDRGALQVCCVDGVDQEAWYNRDAPPAQRARRHDEYDRYLASELVPFIRGKARRDDLIVYGASFGGYHATNFAFRHPELASRVVSFSGLYDIHRFLDGYWDDTCYFHCPTAYVHNFNDDWIRRTSRLEIVVATGEYDHLAPDTRGFASLLGAKGIPARSELWPGVNGHDWPFWIDHLRRFTP